MANSSGFDDENASLEFIRNETRTGNIESRCREYLDDRTFQRQIRSDGGELDALEFYAPVGSCIIQNIIDDQQDSNTINLQGSPPDILPIRILKISDDPDSYIIPSEILTISAIHPRSLHYQLHAIICEINQHLVVFMKHLSTKKWYYYQSNYKCEQFNDTLSNSLNLILYSRSLNEQRRLIESAHFLISMIFFNAVKYIYIRDDN